MNNIVKIKMVILLGNANRKKRQTLKELIYSENNKKGKEVVVPFLFGDFFDHLKSKKYSWFEEGKNNEYEEFIFNLIPHIFLDLESPSTISELFLIERNKLYDKLIILNLPENSNEEKDTLMKIANSNIGFVTYRNLSDKRNEIAKELIKDDKFTFRYRNNLVPDLYYNNIYYYKFKEIYKYISNVDLNLNIYKEHNIDNSAHKITYKIFLNTGNHNNQSNNCYCSLLNSFMDFLKEEIAKKHKHFLPKDFINHVNGLSLIRLSSGRVVKTISDKEERRRNSELNKRLFKEMHINFLQNNSLDIDNSFAYLPNKYASKFGSGTFPSILKHIQNKSNFYIKTDIKSFFESINIEKLKFILNEIIFPKFNYDDGSILDGAIKDISKYASEKNGIVQGVATSSFYSHVYLTPLDLLFINGSSKYIEKILEFHNKNNNNNKDRVKLAIYLINKYRNKIIYTRYSDDIMISTNINDKVICERIIESIQTLLEWNIRWIRNWWIYGV